MNQEQYTLDVASFLNKIVEPVQCLSNIFITARPDFATQAHSEQYDVGVVTAALATLAQIQLGGFAKQLEAQCGVLEVTLPRYENVPSCVFGVAPQDEL